ncbi:hypothetical protein A2524_02800 [Candidatus Wolfebacteria bacterium RIFOXYD12_FULL_48_21]|nr:MAG: hypothetical protein A2524_02800 [Candidatus Wolfebacteria bacterium RIFOXYD12_FULL_48_21]OGM96779.1 MAG: hypothetical protein A2532_02625 [Candidatus Wolfebacteria bacterium RIFOXYD2_FULL_48_11]
MTEQTFGPGKEMNGWKWEEWLEFEGRLEKLSDESLSTLCEKHGIKFEPGYTPKEHIAGALLEATRKEALVYEVEEAERQLS